MRKDKKKQHKKQKVVATKASFYIIPFAQSNKRLPGKPVEGKQW